MLQLYHRHHSDSLAGRSPAELSRWPGLFQMAVEQAESSLQPELLLLPVETATRYRYSLATGEFEMDQVEIKLGNTFLAEGGCRDVYEMHQKTHAGTWVKMVIKYEKDAGQHSLAENLECVRQGIRMQEEVRRSRATPCNTAGTLSLFQLKHTCQSESCAKQMAVLCASTFIGSPAGPPLQRPGPASENRRDRGVHPGGAGLGPPGRAGDWVDRGDKTIWPIAVISMPEGCPATPAQAIGSTRCVRCCCRP